MSVEQDVSWETLKLQPDFSKAVELVADVLIDHYPTDFKLAHTAAEAVLEAIWRVET